MRKYYTNADFLLIFAQQVVLPVCIFFLFGGIRGIIAVLVWPWVKAIVIRVIFPHYEPLTTMDEFFLLDWDKNRSNILTLMKIDRVANRDAFLKFVDERVRSLQDMHPRIRSSIVKRLG